MKRKRKPAIAYTRVSTEGQGINGIGLDGQRYAIETCAELLGYEIEESCSDVASGAGSISKRPGLQQAISIAKARRIPIIVSGLDRLSRDTRTTERIILEEGIEVISATEGKMDNPVTVSSRAARAQHDREMISRRTKEALAKRKQEGVQLGNRKNLSEAQKKGAARNKERSEAKAREIADALENLSGWEGMSASSIVAELNDHDIRTPRGSRWTLSSIRRPLSRAKQIVIERKEQRRVEELSKAYAGNPNFGRF